MLLRQKKKKKNSSVDTAEKAKKENIKYFVMASIAVNRLSLNISFFFFFLRESTVFFIEVAETVVPQSNFFFPHKVLSTGNGSNSGRRWEWEAV